MLTLKKYKNLILIITIYLSFISLGLPDSLLGSAWPIIKNELSVPLSYAGIITMIISGGTIISSLFSERIISKIGTGLTTAVSVALTAIALLGFSISKSFWVLCLLAIPYGLGAGAVDAALNNYVALHYSSRHMSWLHAFWGIGVTISPYIMSYALSHNYGWHSGYRSISYIQLALVAVIFITLPIWKRNANITEGNDKPNTLSLKQTVKLKGAPNVLIAFFCYCALESTAGLWATSYMVNYRNINPTTAARFAALFYIGITFGRIINGFIADKFGDKAMIRTGILIMISGIILIALPFSFTPLIGLIILGIGAAPVYPCIIHSTPDNFGKKNSQSLIGIQMASAYLGTTLMPPVFGIIAQYISIGLYPLYLIVFAVMMLFATEALNNKYK